MMVCVLDAWDPEDPALVNSHWVAEQSTQALLKTHPNAEIKVVAGEELDRLSAEAELSQPHEGFAYFGHGREHVLYRCSDDSENPVPIIGVEQVRLIGARWFHAFACLSGGSLCRDAASSGAAAYLGYCVAVNVEWEVAPLPDELRVLLQDLVTVATLQLAQGERSRDAIRRRVREASDQLVDWLDINEDAVASIHWKELVGLKLLANILHRNLELEGHAVQP